MRPVALAALPFLLLPTLANAVEPCGVLPELGLTAIDEGRLESLIDSRNGAVALIWKQGDADGKRTVAEFFNEVPVAADDIEPGNYLCRTVKLGGPYGIFTAYDFFNCKVSKGEGGLRLEKTSGSQRFSGELIEVGGGLVFVGADHYGDEQPRGYNDDPTRNSVGCLSRFNDEPGAYILEFPKPFLESDHDVIELRAK